jgi:hypothetical protein
MYLSATGDQVENQFFISLERFRSRPAFVGGHGSKLPSEILTAASSSVAPPIPVATSKAYTSNQIRPPVCSLMEVNQSDPKCSMRFPVVTQPSVSS